jgi:hypothetical protein
MIDLTQRNQQETSIQTTEKAEQATDHLLHVRPLLSLDIPIMVKPCFELDPKWRTDPIAQPLSAIVLWVSDCVSCHS